MNTDLNKIKLKYNHLVVKLKHFFLSFSNNFKIDKLRNYNKYVDIGMEYEGESLPDFWKKLDDTAKCKFYNEKYNGGVNAIKDSKF